MTRWLVPALLFVTACTGSDGIGPEFEMDVPVAFDVTVDFQSGNGAQFLFLQPLSNGKPTEPLATGLELTVTICDTSDECVVLEAIEQDDHYHANWKSDKKSADEDFSVVVTGFGIVLGELTLTLENRGSEKAGRTFPIKFWVGEGIGAVVAEVQDCEESILCNSEPVPPDVETTITAEDENELPVAELIFEAEDVPAGGLVVIVDCRSTLPVNPLPTALDQFPVFCDIDVFNPDGTTFEGELDNPADLVICELDLSLHAELLLGKVGGSGFEFLPLSPRTLECADVTTAAGPAQRTLRWLGSRVASLLSPLVPQKLYARALRFRKDGGVGGLITSFSPINPVAPAFITGTVTDAVGDPLVGVVVTLGGSASATTTTDAGGDYSFGPLQAAEGAALTTRWRWTVSQRKTSLSMAVASS